MINKIDINGRWYPKHYTTPNSRIKKLYNLKQKKILRFYYIELFIAPILLILGPLSSLIFLCARENRAVAGILIMGQLCFSFVERICLIVASTVYKRR